VDQLEQLLRPPQVLEPMGAELQQGGTVRQLVGHQGGRGGRQQHLAPMTDAMIRALRITAGPK
jgi:hypothetical protein